MSELEQLKQVLRSLVVSSPCAVDVRSLLRDYRGMMGESLPTARLGFRDPLQFLRERCSDCFLFHGPPTNPILTPIVPESLKHIDEFVQKQRSKVTRLKGKRRSVQEYVSPKPVNNLVAQSFRPIEKKSNLEENYNYNRVIREPNTYTTKTEPRRVEAFTKTEPKRVEAPKVVEPVVPKAQSPSPVRDLSDRLEGLQCNGQNKENEGQQGMCSSQALQRFLQKRLPLCQSQQLSGRSSMESLKETPTSSSGAGSSSGSRQAGWARLSEQVTELVAARPGGVFASELMRLYEDKYGRELNFSRYGFPSISACACAISALSAVRAADGDWLVRARAPGAPDAPAAPPALLLRRHVARASTTSLAPVDPDVALPGIEYDADVFPADCLSFVESIPSFSTAGIAPGDMLALVVGEVYSPSHLWVLRLGPDYERMEDIMDEMTT